ncbi:glycosyltransferase family 9 protein [Mariniblastus fucicola]|uniref:Lipopolysaccharide core heptosyltransferase RfaQ n=1 Tax=Mariniblastus fucicola TaxID=980251 RepID=A0A5B9P8F1_9BACT|nr:glycosyltransferase family 9 protein [Mariniblastus fucicola]QEG20896.1 Lipopolysaccharide core heptosyltransferase RfaQ [Mariniblastus fucicola]
MDEQPKILITRLSHIGDCVLTLPMVNRIKDRFPDSVISWAIESPTQKLLAGHDSVDEFIVVPKAWMKKPANWRELRRQFIQRDFDIAIDPQGITKSAMLAWISGAKTRIGIKGQWGRELSPWLNNRLVETQATHLADRSMELLGAIEGFGEPAGPASFKFPLPETAISFCKSFLDQVQLKRFSIINPGASWASKRWNNERFGSVGSWLFRHQGLRSVLTWAGAEEKAMAEEIAAFDPDAFAIAPSTDLPQLAAMLSLADLFVGCDTGPLHIAAAVGTPCVGLYGTTRPQDSGAWPHALPTPHVAVQKWYQSGSCRKRRGAENDAMMDILAADVFQACENCLGKRRRQSA